MFFISILEMAVFPVFMAESFKWRGLAHTGGRLYFPVCAVFLKTVRKTRIACLTICVDNT